MSINIEICKPDKINGNEIKCTKIKVRRSAIAAILGAMVVAAVINFFIGLALYQPFEYIALSLALSLITLLCAIPIFGLVIVIGYYVPWTSAAVSGLSIASSFWLDALLAATWWICLFVQIAILLIVLYRIFMHITGKKPIHTILK